ncbi:MAG: hypothetical protein LUC43_07855 [Burkholderiales bacterium]|nr:hypothetical protein [Burkholderiales bacterium]
MVVKQKKTLCLSALTSAVCALALVIGGIGAVTSVEAATTLKSPPQTKTIEKKSLSQIKEDAKEKREQAKEQKKEEAKEKLENKLGIQKKEPLIPLKK